MQTKSIFFNKKYVIALTLIAGSFASMFSVSSVKAQNDPLFSEETRFTFRPFSVNGSLLADSPDQPYIAGYMTNDTLEWWGNPGRVPGGAAALRVTVSFSGTDKSVIQSDNFLAAGIAAQGPHGVKPPWIDWGYALVLVLDGGVDDPYIEGVVWKVFEWGRNGQWPWEPPEADLVSKWTWSYPGVLTINSYVTLTMEWNSSHLNYFATIEEVEYSLYSYTPEENQLHYFMLGTTDRKCGVVPLGGTVKWFQFPGAWSEYNIGQVGWYSRLISPQFMESGEDSWKDVPYAYSTDGRYSYLDHTVRWGGDLYENVYATYSQECVMFYPTSDGTTLQPDTLLWAPLPPGDGGGGCPFVYVWNGTQYVVDNNVLGDSEASGGADVEDYYRLEQPLASKEGKYSLLIGEFEQDHSYLDQVRLLAVDHASDVHVAVTHSGEILTYRNPATPISAVDNNGTSRLDEISLVDGDVSDPSTYFYGKPGDYLVLDFGDLDVSDGAKLVFRGNVEKKPIEDNLLCVHVQVLDAEGWVEVAALRTRVTWSTQIVDLSGYLPDINGELKVRLYLTGIHKLDYVGLDTSKQDDFDLYYANLVSAVHSEQGSVKTELSESDGVYAELVPVQQIKLEFTLPENSKEARTYII
ncbi:MAG: hypothetical protein ACE5J6_03350, partial [Candidatus Bathyarchaeia archaeon]